MNAVSDPLVLEKQYERTVREDIELFGQQATAFLAGELSEDGFRAVRLRRGVYGQRQPGVHMVRTKVPGGMLTSAQMRQLARAADEYGGGRGHLTTRQNMQFHFVPLPRVAGLLHLLADARLTTREACSFLKVGRSKLYHLVRERVLPCYRLGAARNSPLRYRKADLMSMLRRNRVILRIG